MTQESVLLIVGSGSGLSLVRTAKLQGARRSECALRFLEVRCPFRLIPVKALATGKTMRCFSRIEAQEWHLAKDASRKEKVGRQGSIPPLRFD
jgi:hypothetical protein